MPLPHEGSNPFSRFEKRLQIAGVSSSSVATVGRECGVASGLLG
jgi:hypothetical protein